MRMTSWMLRLATTVLNSEWQHWVWPRTLERVIIRGSWRWLKRPNEFSKEGLFRCTAPKNDPPISLFGVRFRPTLSASFASIASRESELKTGYRRMWEDINHIKSLIYNV